MDTTNTQEERRWATEDYDVMRDLGMSKEMYLKWWERGLVRMSVDEEDEGAPMVYVRGSDMKLIREHYDRVIGGMVEDNRKLSERLKGLENVPQAIVKKVVHVANRAGGGFGKESYEGRASGKAWSECGGKSPLNAAKSYAKTHGLPWPPQQQK